MPIWVWVVIGVFIVFTAAAVVIRTLKPKQFEPVELEFDMRALKLIKPEESAQARKVAKTKELLGRQYSSSKTRMDDADPPSPGFFG